MAELIAEAPLNFGLLLAAYRVPLVRSVSVSRTACEPSPCGWTWLGGLGCWHDAAGTLSRKFPDGEMRLTKAPASQQGQPGNMKHQGPGLVAWCCWQPCPGSLMIQIEDYKRASMSWKGLLRKCTFCCPAGGTMLQWILPRNFHSVQVRLTEAPACLRTLSQNIEGPGHRHKAGNAHEASGCSKEIHKGSCLFEKVRQQHESPAARVRRHCQKWAWRTGSTEMGLLMEIEV